MSRAPLAGTAGLVMVLIAACGGSSAGGPSQPAASSSTATIAAPSATPAPSPTPSATASTTRPPSRREDAAALQQALLTAADLGRPWVVVKNGLPTGAVQAGCPGKPSAVRRLAMVAEVHRDLTEGPGELINGASFGLATLQDADGSAVRAAWRADTAACREYTDASDYFVVYRQEGPSSARNADEILFSRSERIYFNRGDAEPAYARHTVVARTGRVVTTVSYTFLGSDSSADTGNFARTRKLLERQLAKIATTVKQ